MDATAQNLHDEVEEIDEPFWTEASDAWSNYSKEELEEMLRSENASQVRDLKSQNGWNK